MAIGDAHKNFAYSLVATAPSPATSGTSLVVTGGEGTKFPAVPFNAVIWPTGAQPSTANAEIVRVTAIATDTFTITRAQESTAARTVVVGDQIAAAITSKALTDIEAYLTANADGFQVQGGSTPRTAVFTAGNITITGGGAGTQVHTMPAATDNIMGESNNVAAQSDQETGTSLVKFVSPGRQQFHPSACKFWIQVTGAGTPANSSSYNVTSIADTNTGRMTITIATDFSSANWCCVSMGMGSTTVTSAAIQWGVSKAAGSIEIDNSDLSATPVVEDPTVGYDVAGFGDQ